MTQNHNSNFLNIITKNIEYLNEYKEYISKKSFKQNTDNLTILGIDYKINVLQSGLEIIKNFPYKINNSRQLFIAKNKDQIDGFFANTLDYIIEYNKFENIIDNKFMIYQHNKNNSHEKNSKLSEEETDDNGFVMLNNEAHLDRKSVV